MNRIDNFFGITKNNSSFKVEIIGGISAYLSMAYIIFVNPIILSQAGMNSDAVFVATIISAAIATLIMGLYAKFPLALAPCMSMNAFFAYSVVLGMGFSWQQALACVFVSSIIFMILTLTGLRVKIITAIPNVLKIAGNIGLGLFIAFVGLKNADIIIFDENTLIKFGTLTDPNTLIACFGLIVLFLLLVKKSKYAVFFSMALTVIFGLVLHYFNPLGLETTVLQTLPTLPETLFVSPVSIIKTMFDETMFVAVKTIPEIMTFSGLSVILTFAFLDFMGTSTTLNAATSQIENYDIPVDSKKIYFADAIGSFFGAIFGTSNVTTFIESVGGLVSGARTGLVAVVVAILFLLSLFLHPFLSLITSAVTTPALVAIGVFMFINIKDINWTKGFEETIPAFLTIILMPLTGSIALALSVGFLMYTILMVIAKRHSEIHKYMYIISFVAFVYLMGEVL